MVFVLMIRLPPGSTRTHTLFPDTTLCLSGQGQQGQAGAEPDEAPGQARRHRGGARRARDAVRVPRADAAAACVVAAEPRRLRLRARSEEHTSELQSLMRISYAVFCLKKKNKKYLSTCSHHNNPIRKQ